MSEEPVPAAEEHCGKKVLIVEDDPTIRDSIRLLLELEGYATLTAGNGREGLALLQRAEGPGGNTQSERPCLILLDLMMPVMNGWEFVEELDQDGALAAIPVVVVTAYSERARELGARKRVIKKPIDIELLLGLVHAHCGPPGEAAARSR